MQNREPRTRVWVDFALRNATPELVNEWGAIFKKGNHRPTKPAIGYLVDQSYLRGAKSYELLLKMANKYSGDGDAPPTTRARFVVSVPGAEDKHEVERAFGAVVGEGRYRYSPTGHRAVNSETTPVVFLDTFDASAIFLTRVIAADMCRGARLPAPTLASLATKIPPLPPAIAHLPGPVGASKTPAPAPEHQQQLISPPSDPRLRPNPYFANYTRETASLGTPPAFAPALQPPSFPSLDPRVVTTWTAGSGQAAPASQNRPSSYLAPDPRVVTTWTASSSQAALAARQQTPPPSPPSRVPVASSAANLPVYATEEDSRAKKRPLGPDGDNEAKRQRVMECVIKFINEVSSVL